METLYIDDIRNPVTDRNWKIVRSSIEAINYLERYGCPEYISFDHDLGGDDTSMIIVNWLIEMDLDLNGEFIPEEFDYNVHSANPVGANNICGKLDGYLKSRKPS